MKMSTLTRVARAQEGPKAKMLAHLSRLCPMMNAIREQLRILYQRFTVVRFGIR